LYPGMKFVPRYEVLYPGMKFVPRNELSYEDVKTLLSIG
jgi:hypothetical protein